MTRAEQLQSMVGAPGDRCVIVAPAATWKVAPKQLLRRLAGRIRAGLTVSEERERVIWDAPSVGSGRIDAIRERMLSGEIHVHRSSMSPLGAVRVLARFTPTDRVHIGASGGLRQLGMAASRNAILRLGAVESPGDPAIHYRALERFAGARLPAPLGSGRTDTVSWSVESMLPGRQPHGLDSWLLEQVSDFLTSLPAPDGDVDVFSRAASTLEPLDIPGFDVRELARRLEGSLASLPATVTHGDLWTGNLLVDEGRLSGVVDWDSWAERGAPGTDILHLHAEHQRRTSRSSYGAVVEARFWEDEDVSDAVSRHMHIAGVAWRPALLTELARAWWMTTIAGSVRRSPGLAADRGWIAANVSRPSRVFETLTD